ncbi:hypothetical protein [Telluribacter sp.]|jgi:hypothetical protein|uniref:hypothetical protein n=1 Tax=Telluribacter sp. TaxID=1978767 RepID=UPI002E1244AC|nr:hypothetical protein [Telluribacter sp.]
MKNLYATLTVVLVLLCPALYAQHVPSGMQYQAVARDLKGNILADQEITLKINLTSNTAKATTVQYSETHKATTNKLGLFTLVIGAGQVQQGTFRDIPWSTEDIWMQIAIQDPGKSAFSTISNSKLLAVPYAFHAISADRLSSNSTAREAATQAGIPSQTWSLFGNIKSDPKKDKLGTSDFVDLVLVTNNLDRLRISANGDINIKNSLDVGKDLGVGNDLDVGNDLRVKNDVHLNTVSGATINNGNFTVANAKPTYLTGILTVDKAALLKTTLQVDGITNLNSDLYVNNMKPTLLSGLLSVDKNATFKEFVKITNANLGSTSISTGALVVAGGTGIGQNLFVGGTGNIAGTLGVTGATALKSTLSVTDATILSNTLNVTGITALNSNLNVTGPTSLDNNLQVLGQTRLLKQVTISANVPGGDENFGAYPLRVEGSNQGIAISINGERSASNNYVTFWDSKGVQGRIEGQNSTDLLKDPEYILFTALGASELAIAIGSQVAAAASANACAGVGVVACPPIVSLNVLAALEIAEQVIRFSAEQAFFHDNLGVSYQSGGADYAEWLPKNIPSESINYGEIVGVVGGKISKNTQGAKKFMVVSRNPIVLGNVKDGMNKAESEMVAFMGQVPVRVAGAAAIGDYILTSGRNDGMGIAKSPSSMTIDDFENVVGIAWSASTNPVMNFINTAIGINTNDLVQVVKKQDMVNSKQQQEIDQLKSEIAEMKQLVVDIAKGKDIKIPDLTTRPQITDNTKPTTVIPPVQAPVTYRTEPVISLATNQINEQYLRAAFTLLEGIYKKNGIDIKNVPALRELFENPASQTEVFKKLNVKISEISPMVQRLN